MLSNQLEKLLVATRTLIRGRRCRKSSLAEGLIDEARELLEESEADSPPREDLSCLYRPAPAHASRDTARSIARP
jgi:hypothetical protein